MTDPCDTVPNDRNTYRTRRSEVDSGGFAVKECEAGQAFPCQETWPASTQTRPSVPALRPQVTEV